jgi:hypothetical protein
MDITDVKALPAVARATFDCARGHGLAGEVRLHGAGEHWVVVVDSFLSATIRVGTGDATELRCILEAGDVAALYRADLELTPFFCPKCAAVYCQACWRTYNVFDEEMPGWFEETRGTCPDGHERMLMD